MAEIITAAVTETSAVIRTLITIPAIITTIQPMAEIILRATELRSKTAIRITDSNLRVRLRTMISRLRASKEAIRLSSLIIAIATTAIIIRIIIIPDWIKIIIKRQRQSIRLPLFF